MEYHEFADIWPLIEGDDYEKLKADIKAHGQKLPIITWKGKILDGRNRDRACAELGITPLFEEFKARTDNDALSHAVSLNLMRRHLSLEQRAFVGEKLANLGRGGWRGNRYTGGVVENSSKPSIDGLLEKGGLEPITVDGAAAMLKIAPASITRARAIEDHAPELKAVVLSGGMKLSAAAEQAYERRKAGKAPKLTVVPKAASSRPIAAPSANLSRLPRKEDVDPEWTGGALAFADEYGYVHTQTSRARSTDRYGAMSVAVRHAVKEMRKVHPPKVTDAVVSWLRSPKEKDHVAMAEFLPELEALVRDARRLYDRASEVLGEKGITSGEQKFR